MLKQTFKKASLTLPPLKETDTVRDLSLRDLFLPQKCDIRGDREEVSCQSGKYSCLEVRWCYVQILAQPLEGKKQKIGILILLPVTCTQKVCGETHSTPYL